jgi:uncharacterized protein
VRQPGVVVAIDDLIGHLERRRQFSGSTDVSLRVGDSVMKGAMDVEGWVVGTIEGARATYRASAPVSFTCARCLAEWAEDLTVEGSQHFSRVPDEDGYAIVSGTIDLAAPAIDELSLAIPPAPLCSPECKGLCPICGTDLNEKPCDGHRDESDSPFATLRQLFDS